LARHSTTAPPYTADGVCLSPNAVLGGGRLSVIGSHRNQPYRSGSGARDGSIDLNQRSPNDPTCTVDANAVARYRPHSEQVSYSLCGSLARHVIHQFTNCFCPAAELVLVGRVNRTFLCWRSDIAPQICLTLSHSVRAHAPVRVLIDAATSRCERDYKNAAQTDRIHRQSPHVGRPKLAAHPQRLLVNSYAQPRCVRGRCRVQPLVKQPSQSAGREPRHPRQRPRIGRRSSLDSRFVASRALARGCRTDCM